MVVMRAPQPCIIKLVILSGGGFITAMCACGGTVGGAD
jgi:hypothetical protein